VYPALHWAESELRLTAGKHATESMSPEQGEAATGESAPADDPQDAEDSQP
jgi:hypothetical protein